MRPTANFTLHAILAACLAALAASGAATGRPQIDNEGHVFLSGAILGSPGASQGQQLEVHGFAWGPRQSTSVDSFTRKPQPGKESDASAGKGGSNELRMEDSAGGAEAAKERQAGLADTQAEKLDQQRGHSMLGASDRVTNAGTPTEGQATGKRQHKPMVTRGYYDQAAPLPSGSLTVLASGTSCRVGARYPSLALSDRGKSYLLEDAQVADCGSAAGPEQQITFVYGKVKVRGWDPEKKEQ